MSNYKRKRKFNWKGILSAVLLVGALVGVFAVLGATIKNETKTISSLSFEVGGINGEGNHINTKTSIYTKDMFECQGLTIEPDFEATGTYQVFYYDSNKNFIHATDVFKVTDGVYKKGNNIGNAKYARIVITPDVPIDEDANEEKDFKIRFYEVASYASDYVITVNKKQNFKLPNLFIVDESKIGYTAGFNEIGYFVSTPNVDKGYVTLNVNNYRNLTFKYAENANIENNTYIFMDENSHLILESTQPNGDYVVDITVPSGAVYMIVNYTIGSEPAIY